MPTIEEVKTAIANAIISIINERNPIQFDFKKGDSSKYDIYTTSIEGKQLEIVISDQLGPMLNFENEIYFGDEENREKLRKKILELKKFNESKKILEYQKLLDELTNLS
jgi:hypothetical protein